MRAASAADGWVEGVRLITGVMVAVTCLVTSEPAGVFVRAQPEIKEDDLLGLVGRYVEEYFSRAQTLLSHETVRLQPLARDLSASGRARELLFEVRAEWTPASGDGAPPVAHVLRNLLRADGRAPTPRDAENCLDPRAVTPEPLAFLLPARQHEYVFNPAGTDREEGVMAHVIEFHPAVQRPPIVEWRDRCVSVTLDGAVRGRVWVVPDTGQVLRLDERSLGMIDIPVPRKQQGMGAAPSMTLERVDSSIRYSAVAFTEPTEILILPSSIETLAVWRNAGSPRMRTWHRFSNYRRFVTSGRVVR
jgi:hypothetical protein